jgi:hypothetical protein
MAFNSKSGNFDLEYTPNLNMTKNTEIYMNTRLYYPHGYHVDLEPSACWDTYLAGSTLEVRRKREARPSPRSQASDCQGKVKLALSPASSNGEDTTQILV